MTETVLHGARTGRLADKRYTIQTPDGSWFRAPACGTTKYRSNAALLTCGEVLRCLRYIKPGEFSARSRATKLLVREVSCGTL